MIPNSFEAMEKGGDCLGTVDAGDSSLGDVEEGSESFRAVGGNSFEDSENGGDIIIVWTLWR